MNYGKSSMGGIGGAWNEGTGLQNGSAWREGMQSTGVTERDRRPVEIAFDGNEQAMLQLHNLLTYLEASLAPVLAYAGNGPAEAECTEPGPVSKLVGQIEGSTRGLYSACGRVQAILDRLTV